MNRRDILKGLVWISSPWLSFLTATGYAQTQDESKLGVGPAGASSHSISFEILAPSQIEWVCGLSDGTRSTFDPMEVCRESPVLDPDMDI